MTRSTASVALLLVATLAAGCMTSPARPPASAGAASPDGAAPAAEGKGSGEAGVPDVAPRLTAPGAIADIAERATPSVVAVFATKVTKATRLPRNHPLRRFFRTPRRPREQRGLGSGVIVDRGVVLTNNHVVEGATEVFIKDFKNRRYEAQVVGTDPKTDLAVLRVEGDGALLEPIPLGDSQRLRLGEIVLAIGNPFGVGHTVTMGIVSAKGRANVGIVDYEDFIQTDAAINPGNSGGALVNMSGQLVGINTAILSRSGGYQGIGFAIPSGMIRPVLRALLDTGHVSRGWLGVSIQSLTSDLAEALEMPGKQGVLVTGVQPGGPAARAGLKRGDVVLQVDGKAVDSTGRLRNIISLAGSKVTVTLDVRRGKKALTIPVKLGQLKEKRRKTKAAVPADRSLDGLSLEDLDPVLRKRFGVPAKERAGALVTGIERGSTAHKAGLAVGDLIVEVDRQSVTDVADFQRRWRQAKGKTLLVIKRRGVVRYVVVNK